MQNRPAHTNRPTKIKLITERKKRKGEKQGTFSWAKINFGPMHRISGHNERSKWKGIKTMHLR